MCARYLRKSWIILAVSYTANIKFKLDVMYAIMMKLFSLRIKKNWRGLKEKHKALTAEADCHLEYQTFSGGSKKVKTVLYNLVICYPLVNSTQVRMGRQVHHTCQLHVASFFSSNTELATTD